MIISPIKAIEEGWIVGNITDEMIQPNGIDFTLNKLYQLDPYPSPFMLSLTSKQHTAWHDYNPDNAVTIGDVTEARWHIKKNEHYDFQSDLRVTLPRDVTALLIIRSTLARNGMFITSGLYDSGFDGQIGGQLRSGNVPGFISVGARIGQIVFMESQSSKSYSGSYQSKKEHWTGE